MIFISDLITNGIPDGIVSLINLLLGILFMSVISITGGIPYGIISLINLLLGILFMSMISLETYYGYKIVNELFTLKKRRVFMSVEKSIDIIIIGRICLWPLHIYHHWNYHYIFHRRVQKLKKNP
jgi:hypothetical protein